MKCNHYCILGLKLVPNWFIFQYSQNINKLYHIQFQTIALIFNLRYVAISNFLAKNQGFLKIESVILEPPIILHKKATAITTVWKRF